MSDTEERELGGETEGDAGLHAEKGDADRHSQASMMIVPDW